MGEPPFRVHLVSQPIPFFRPTISDAEISNVTRSLSSGWLTTGPMVRNFEEQFAAKVGAEHAVALNSATAALHLALIAHGVGAGDEVIIPTLTFAAAGEVVLAVGAVPVLVDIDPSTNAIDEELALAAVTPATRAIMPMHYGGLACDVTQFMKLKSDRPDIVVIDDAAHAFPTPVDDGFVGTTTDGSCFSFYANKTITTGEGGMFTTGDGEIADRVRRLSLHGLSRDAWKRFETRSAWDYDIAEAGWKYNLTDLAAGIGLAQLDRADEFAQGRRRAAEQYDELLGDADSIRLVSAGRRQESSCHLYVIRIDPEAGFSRGDVIDRLGAADIGSSVHYRPLHMHSFYRDQFGYQAEDYPEAAQAFQEMVSLPLFPSITEAEVGRVVEVIRSCNS